MRRAEIGFGEQSGMPLIQDNHTSTGTNEVILDLVTVVSSGINPK
jgi:hypothetical protein